MIKLKKAQNGKYEIDPPCGVTAESADELLTRAMQSMISIAKTQQVINSLEQGLPVEFRFEADGAVHAYVDDDNWRCNYCHRRNEVRTHPSKCAVCWKVRQGIANESL